MVDEAIQCEKVEDRRDVERAPDSEKASQT